MSKNFALKAEKRERAGKGIARAVRREGKIPGVIYGDHKEPVVISMPEKELTLEYHKGHMFTNLCDMDVSGEKHTVLARDVQLHPVTDRMMHVDFLRVTPKTKLNVMIPVHFVGQEECPGLKEKGVLNVVRHEVEMTVQAVNIPENIEISLAGFEIGDSIKISAATLPEGSKPAITDRDFTIATIAAPKTAAAIEEEEAAEASAEAAAEASAEAAASEEAAEE
ncbi:MAG: 50S ribosomal protein L25/general stress protein Ctc [Rhodospirillales bacterium]|nr:50S ribosomal protein L25/general stress protein Ctc [Rhodospirillales bacterium]